MRREKEEVRGLGRRKGRGELESYSGSGRIYDCVPSRVLSEW